MTQDMGINPLMDFARKTECSVKLPSQGLWYDDDMITFNAIGEVDIKPMLPNDEMLIVNPESLISGDAIISLIKSCCPSIKRPEELYYPDINALLLGIRKATYGEKLTQQYICPLCWSKKTDIENEEYSRVVKEKFKDRKELNMEDAKELREEVEKNCAPKITEMEKEGKICVTPKDVELSADMILSKMTLMPNNCIVETKEGLKIYVTPNKCGDKIKFINQQIKIQKITKYYESQNMKDLTDEEFELNPEYINSLKKVADMYIDATDLSMDLVSASIKKVVLPSGEEVTNRDFIDQFVKNVSVDVVTKIKTKIDELNNYGIQQTIPMTCECCGHKWDEKFYGFNQSDFFGISS